MISLREMKYFEPYMNSIGNIGMDPFDVFFATPFQKALLQKETNRRKIIISFDATGVPIIPPKTSSYSLTHGRFKSIFLYVIVVRCADGSNMPVYQFLSQRQDATNIRFALDTWKQQNLGNKNVDEVITDAGAAVVLAAIKAFAQCNDCVEYGDKCYDALFEEKKTPKAYIRLDRAHTVHTIMLMFKNLDRNKKRFYTRILGYLLTCEDIQAAKVIIENTFIALLNRFQYNDVVTKAIAFLKNVTDTHIIPDDAVNGISTKENGIKLNGDEKENFMPKKDKHKFFSWIESMLEDVKTYVNTELNDSTEQPTPEMVENAFYAPEVEKTLVVFLSKIHQWSNVMMSSFGSTNATPTSAGSESHFNLLKSVVFPNENKMRSDIFTRRYIDFLNGLTLKSIVGTNTNEKASQQSPEKSATDEMTADDFETGMLLVLHSFYDLGFVKLLYSFIEQQEAHIAIDNDELDQFGEPNEPWGGKNVDIKANPIKRRCKNSILEPMKNKAKPRIMMNANLCNSRGKKGVRLSNSCPFDSCFMLSVCQYLDSPIYQEYVKKNEAQEFMNHSKRFCEWDKMEDMLLPKKIY